MSCYLIRVENGHKVARSITSQEEYKLIRGSYEQKANLRLAREGNDGAKRRLVQFNYSGHYPQGVVKGTKQPSRAFGFDLDDKQDFEKAAKLMLQEPEVWSADAGTQRTTRWSCGLQARNGQDDSRKPG